MHGLVLMLLALAFGGNVCNWFHSGHGCTGKHKGLNIDCKSLQICSESVTEANLSAQLNLNTEK